MANSIFWYDLETFGLESRHDKIAQFAGIRTDENLNQISDKLVLYNKISIDYLPNPYSCLVHKISPQETLEKGIPEYEFAKAIRAEMMVPGTCTTGYNSIQFDDEFIRNLFYRNLFDPYEREWLDGNSRWDVINLFRAAHDLRPEGIQWPQKEDGKPDFRLTSLADANSVKLESAHDAFNDIFATIGITKLVKEKQARLFDWYWKHRTRDSLRPLINLAEHRPIVLTAAQFTRKQGCSTLVAPVGTIPKRRDNILCIDLRYDPSLLLDLSVEQIQAKVFAKASSTEAQDRIPLVVLKLSHCPYIAPLSIIDKSAAERLELDLKAAKKHSALLSKEPELIQKLQSVFSIPPMETIDTDPEYRIYSGGFFRDEDKSTLAAVHELIATQGPKDTRPQAYRCPFIDERIPQLIRRLFARNWPNTLTVAEKKRWRSFCAGKILCPRINKATSLAEFDKIINTLLNSLDTMPEDKLLLSKLLSYRTELETEVLSYKKE